MARSVRSYRAAHKARKLSAKKKLREAGRKAASMAHVFYDPEAGARIEAIGRLERRLIKQNAQRELAALEQE